ncbi:MAG: hypothetical protein ABIQ31_24785 [Ferruginibacter sp.]
MPAEQENKKFNDDQTDKRIHEHLANENDSISEEDINNVKTDVADKENIVSTSVAKEKSSEKDANDESDEEGKKDKGEQENRIETPWNILR